MAFDDLLTLAGLLNVLTLASALGWLLWKKPQGVAKSVLLVIAGGTGFHFVTDLVADLGEHGEHILMHLVALVAVAVIALAPE